MTHVKTAGCIGNTVYQVLLGVAKRITHRDLMDLVKKGILEKTGRTGKGTTQVLRKGAMKGPKGPKEQKGRYDVKVKQEKSARG